MNLTRICWRYTGCANMIFLRRGFRKLSWSIDDELYVYDMRETCWHINSSRWNKTPRSRLLQTEILICIQLLHIHAVILRRSATTIGVKGNDRSALGEHCVRGMLQPWQGNYSVRKKTGESVSLMSRIVPVKGSTGYRDSQRHRRRRHHHLFISTNY